MTDEIERLRSDAARYRWLRENAGRWSCHADLGTWVRDGIAYRPCVAFAANHTAYHGQDLDSAIDAAMEQK